MNAYFWLSALQEMQTFALHVALSGVCVCLVVLAAARMVRRRSEPLRYGVLLGGVLGLLLSPLIVGVGHSVPWPWARLEATVVEEVIRVPMDLLPRVLGSTHDAPAEEPTWILAPLAGAVPLVLWALGTAVGLLRLVRAGCRQHGAAFGLPWCADYWTSALKDRLARQLGLREFPKVIQSPAAPMPMVVGLWRPVIVLPELAPSTWRRAQWEMVLLHEAAHIARHDQWAALAQRIAALLFWWCPPVHRLNRLLSELREHICDDCALQEPADRLSYAELLLETAECMLGLKNLLISPALLDSARTGLEARITRLLEKERQPMTKLSWFGKLAGAGPLLAACLVATAGTAFSGGPAPQQKKVQIKIIVDGKEIDLHNLNLAETAGATEKKPTPQVQSVPVPKKVVVEVPVLVPAPTKPDPRIEELVKQAETIKPGSGEAIRRALEGEARGRIYGYLATDLAKQFPYPYRLTTSTGKQVIILSIQDGKVQQLTPDDLKKVLPQGTRIEVDFLKKKADAAKTEAKPGLPLLAPLPAGAPADLDALRRQLERLNADLQELRKRLDAGKK